MAKKYRLVDKKMEKVVSILGQASDEITHWAEEAQLAINEINKLISDINKEVGEESITPEDAGARIEKECAKPYGKLYNRIKRMTKNTKAMSGLLNAIKAMQDEEEK